MKKRTYGIKEPKEERKEPRNFAKPQQSFCAHARINATQQGNSEAAEQHVHIKLRDMFSVRCHLISFVVNR